MERVETTVSFPETKFEEFKKFWELCNRYPPGEDWFVGVNTHTRRYEISWESETPIHHRWEDA